MFDPADFHAMKVRLDRIEDGHRMLFRHFGVPHPYYNPLAVAAEVAATEAVEEHFGHPEEPREG